MKSPKAKSETKVLTAADLDRLQIETELARLDVRLQRAVRRWQLAGQDETDAFRGLKVTDAEATALLQRPVAANWGTIGLLPPDEAAAFDAAEQQAARDCQQIVTTAKHLGVPLRLNRLAAVFNLDRFDVDVLLICLAPTLDLRYERLYGYLQDDVTRQHPTLNLMLDLLAEAGLSRVQWQTRFDAAAPLRRHQLIELVTDPQPHPSTSPLGQAYRLDRAIAAWLLGHYQPQVELGGQARLSAAPASALDELLTAPVRAEIERASQTRSIVALHGVDAASQQAAARVLAQICQRPLLTVDLAGIVGESTSALAAVRLALRDARLTGALPCLTGWEVCLHDGAPAPDVLAEICSFEEAAIIASPRPWQPRGVDRARALLWLEFPIPDYTQRLALWQHFIGGSAVASHFDLAKLDLTLLAGQFALTAAQIRDAVASARDAAAQHNTALHSQHLFAAARAHSSPVLGSLARKISPRYAWSDIVLPDDQVAMLREIIDTVRGRPVVLETWGVGDKLASSSGVTVLFSGPPGTGKTMAAEVIAAELELDLYKIDLSTVINKYIGETEKNLGRIFDEAASSNAILFFDEADAIFGKRSEVKDSHDRYANIEISYLLQRMEAYDGVTILATNLRANMDEAFKRRLQFAVDFPFPDEAYRHRIWQTLFPPGVPRAAELDLALLAKRFKLAGGNIRNIIISAAYLAASNGGIVNMDHLLHGARRELQKMGRLIDGQE